MPSHPQDQESRPPAPSSLRPWSPESQLCPLSGPSPLLQDSGFQTPALTTGTIEEEGLPGGVLKDNYRSIILVQTAGYLSHPTLSHCHILCLYFLSCPWTSRQRDRIGDSLRGAIQSLLSPSVPRPSKPPIPLLSLSFSSLHPTLPAGWSPGDRENLPPALEEVQSRSSGICSNEGSTGHAGSPEEVETKTTQGERSGKIRESFWSLDLQRPCSFRACPLAALTLSGERARTSFLEDERPHRERSPARSPHHLPAM